MSPDYSEVRDEPGAVLPTLRYLQEDRRDYRQQSVVLYSSSVVKGIERT
jgi:hypothetical protein